MQSTISISCFFQLFYFFGFYILSTKQGLLFYPELIFLFYKPQPQPCTQKTKLVPDAMHYFGISSTAEDHELFWCQQHSRGPPPPPPSLLCAPEQWQQPEAFGWDQTDQPTLPLKQKNLSDRCSLQSEISNFMALKTNCHENLGKKGRDLDYFFQC